jgi:hypothetical protein
MPFLWHVSCVKSLGNVERQPFFQICGMVVVKPGVYGNLQAQMAASSESCWCSRSWMDLRMCIASGEGAAAGLRATLERPLWSVMTVQRSHVLPFFLGAEEFVLWHLDNHLVIPLFFSDFYTYILSLKLYDRPLKWRNSFWPQEISPRALSVVHRC